MAKVYGDRWEAIESLDEGGQAHVFRVRDKQNPSQEYALRRLKNDKRTGRFEREIEAVRKLDDPGIIKIVDFSVEAPAPYYVMELVHGGNLAGRVKSYEGDLVRSLDLFCRICEAVAAAHLAGIVHRDLRPENILFRTRDDDQPVVSDFGICWIEDGARFTATEEAVGARYFTAPELEAGRAEEVTAAADVYGLGKLLYYTITGGSHVPREAHRHERYDLRQVFKHLGLGTLHNIQMEYVSELLDGMIIEDPRQRSSNVAEIGEAAAVAKRLVAEGFYPMAEHMPCKFCGEGIYKPHGPRPVVLDTKNWSGVTAAMFECDHCGHLHMFSWYKFEALTGQQAHR
jgi:serine/threonine protein kinase